MYVDDLNLIGTPKELTRIEKYLKNELEMKYVGKIFLSRPTDQAFPY